MTDTEWEAGLEEIRLMSCDLILMSYTFNRENGVTAEGAALVFDNADMLEKAYQFSIKNLGVIQ